MNALNITGMLRIHRMFLIAIVLLASIPASAQTRVGFNLSGMWSPMYHEDELERTDPGSPGVIISECRSTMTRDCEPTRGMRI